MERPGIVTIHQALSAIAQSASKFATDVRLLSHEGEIEEPSESKQIGSSAMAYKKNPMRCERVCSLARYVIEAANTSAHTAATTPTPPRCRNPSTTRWPAATPTP